MTHNQRRNFYTDRLRELTRLGLAMPFEYGFADNETTEIVVEQAGSDLECPIYDLGDGRTLYVVWLSLLAERSGPRLHDYSFEPPWRDDGFEPWPKFINACVGEYCYLTPEVYFPTKDVLNFNFLRSGWRLPSARVDGVLCALSDSPIPEEYKHGATIPVAVKFYSRLGRQLAATSVVMWLDRWDAQALTRPTAQSPVALENSADPGVYAPPPRTSVFEEIEKNDLSTAGRHRVPLAAESTFLSNSFNQNSFNRSPGSQFPVRSITDNYAGEPED